MDSREAKERAEFQVGGREKKLTPEEQLEQLATYLDAHHPAPDFTPPWAAGHTPAKEADNYCARIPDRSTHAAMLMLGAGLNHAMPGVAYPGNIEVTESPELHSCVFHPTHPTDQWAISLHGGGWWRGSGTALDMQWRPEVAGAAQHSGCTIIDVDYPLAPDHSVADMQAAIIQAIDYARAEGATHLSLWGYSSGAALAATLADRVDALVLTYPDLSSLTALPEDIRGSSQIIPPHTWPQTLVQIALKDEVVENAYLLDSLNHPQIQVREYMSRHRICTPKVARQRIKDVAEFLQP